MNRNAIILVSLLFLTSCLENKKELSSNITEIRIVEDVKEALITDKDKIKRIELLVETLQEEINDFVPLNNNDGFIEVLYKTEDNIELSELLTITFTKNHGNVILYSKKKIGKYKYYYNDKIVQIIKKELIMSQSDKNN